MADELTEAVLACSTMQTRVTRTLIDVTQAPGIVVATWTLTPEAVNQIHTAATIGARTTGALIDVSLTVQSSESSHTLTRVPTNIAVP